MASRKLRILSVEAYEQYAREYIGSLSLEQFAEALGQSQQRAITLKSLDMLKAYRPEVQVFNKLLVQYHHGRDSALHQVVPDNMVLIWNEPIEANLSFDLPLQPVRPFWVLDYLSRYSWRKDYGDHFHKFERELKVRYYMRFDADNQQLTLYRHTGRKYVLLKPNRDGRLALAELDLEIGLQGKWVRYWYQGELLLLPGEMLHKIEAIHQQIKDLEQQTEQAKRQTEEAKQCIKQAKQARLAATREIARLRAKPRRTQNK